MVVNKQPQRTHVLQILSNNFTSFIYTIKNKQTKLLSNFYDFISINCYDGLITVQRKVS